jgi:hypothetical protein
VMVDVGCAYLRLTVLRLAEPTAQSRRCVAPQDHCQKNELGTRDGGESDWESGLW